MPVRKAFTLIEIALVIVLSSMLAGAVIPNFVRSVRIEAGKKAALEMSQLAESARAFYVDQHQWPQSLEMLRTAGFVDSAWPGNNPFGAAYAFALEGSNLQIRTLLPVEIAPVTAALLPMATVTAKDVAMTITQPGASGMVVPTGVVVPWSSREAPDGWLVCDGRAVSREEYTALFAVIGITYGAGDGMATFNLPDLRGRAVVGLDDMGAGVAHVVTDARARILGGMFGEERHQMTIDEMPAHAHAYGQAYSGGRYDGHSSPLFNANQESQTSLAGGGQAHNNLQPSMALYWVIKT